MAGLIEVKLTFPGGGVYLKGMVGWYIERLYHSSFLSYEYCIREVKDVAKKTKFAGLSPEERKQKRDELLELAVNECNAAGRLLSRRAWTHNSFIDFDELVEFVGKGSYARAESMIALMWTNQQKQMKEIRKELESENQQDQPVDDAQSTEEKTEETEALPEEVKVEQQLDDKGGVDAEMAQEKQIATEAAPQETTTTKRTRSRRYTKEELVELLKEIKAYYQLEEGLPSQVQINEYAKLFNKPQYPAFVRKLGPKRDWAKVLELLELTDDDSTKGSAETGEAALPEVKPVVQETELVAQKPEIEAEAESESAADADESTDGTDTLLLEAVVEDVWLKLNVDGKAMNVHLRFSKE